MPSYTERRFGGVVIQVLRQRLQNKRTQAVADHGQDFLGGVRWVAEMRERFVGHVDQVGQRIEQCAVHIEHERLEGFVGAK